MPTCLPLASGWGNSGVLAASLDWHLKDIRVSPLDQYMAIRTSLLAQHASPKADNLDELTAFLSSRGTNWQISMPHLYARQSDFANASLEFAEG